MKRSLNRKIKGYAITLEVIFTIAMFATFFNATIYLLNALNVQRYMDTVLTSTVIQAAKWGGTNSNAYLANGMNYSILDNARQQLSDLPRGFSASISATPEKISKEQRNVEVTVKWKLPSFFGFPSKNITATSEMEAIMKPGGLL